MLLIIRHIKKNFR